MQKNRSGQYIYFALNSAISGNPVTGASGAISGRKSLDGLSGLIVLSGNIIELGGGSYRANLFDFDTDGNQAGYFFSASGCVPVQYQFDMIDGNASGRVWLATDQRATLSGIHTIVPIASISGNVSNSGLTVTVLPATISGVNTIADVTRWRNVTPNALLASGRLDAAFNTRTNVARSGTANTVQLDASTPTGISGVYDGQLITITGGSGAGETRRILFYSASGIATVDKDFFVAPFENSVFTITPEANPSSGQFVNVPKATISGVVANSGLTTTTIPATISGTTVIVLPATLSGVVANSGLFVSVPIASISGTNTVVPVASLSGVNTIASVARWNTHPVVSESISGVPIVDIGYSLGVAVTNNDGTLLSGGSTTAYLASGNDSNDDYYNGRKLTITTGTGAGQSRWIIDYTGATRIATLDKAWVTTPGSGSDYIFEDYQASGNIGSGTVFIASGPFVNVVPATISGVFSTVLPANLSGVVANSGLTVTVLKATISGVVANSGLFVTATATVASGDVYLASGHGFYLSGQIFLASGTGGTAVVNSGSVFLASGHYGYLSGINAVVPISTISGVVANSGLFVTVPKETISGVVANSGLFVTTTVASGTAYLASGHFLFGSGQFFLASGSLTTVDPATLSGTFVTVPKATISGTNAVVPPANLSGVFSTVLPENLSGVVANSGLTISQISGTGYPASGIIGRAVLTHPFSGVTGFSGQRNLLNAQRKLMNKWDLTTSGYLTVYVEDDTTMAYRQSLTSQSGAAPITSLDTTE